jgi:hypothetical protein
VIRSRTRILLALLAATLSSTGCLTIGTNNVTHERLQQGLIVFVEDSSDAGNRNWQSFEDGMGSRGVSVALDNFDWSPQLMELAFTGAVPYRDDIGEAAIVLAEQIRNYQIAYPGRPIHLVGHGHGCHIAVTALEHLDSRLGVDRLVLLSPGFDHHRNLSYALKRVRDSAVAYYSYQNVAHGLAGPFVFGTPDTARSRGTAAQWGVRGPVDADMYQYEKLHVLVWNPWMALGGNLGGHNVGATSPAFVRKYIRPFLLDGELVDFTDDDLDTVGD